MSFSTDVKEELARVEAVCSHCDRALLAAIVRIEGSLFLSGKGMYRLEISIDAPYVARLVLRLLHDTYGLETSLTVRSSVLHKTPNFLISVPTQPKLSDALKDMGVLGDEGLQLSVAPSLVAKQCCAAAYMRGAFLGGGFVADPRGDFHFEITVESQQLAQSLVDILESKDIHAHISHRRSSYIVYLKSGEAILQFLAFVGAHRSALLMENVRVVKSVRNDVNRQANADFANTMKKTNASIDQRLAMRELVRHYGMENLPPALREIIRLRAMYPEDSLKELGERANPPLSKSAVYHRMRRIEQMASELK